MPSKGTMVCDIGSAEMLSESTPLLPMPAVAAVRPPPSGLGSALVPTRR